MSKAAGLPPREVAIVGAGILGLSTAWFLSEAGVRVTVFDKDKPGAGASWGNAGWLTPNMATPLPSPSILRYGFGAMFNPKSPLYIPPRADIDLWKFLLGFVLSSTTSRYRRSTAAVAPLAAGAFQAYDLLLGDADVSVNTQPLYICYRNTAEAENLLSEIEENGQLGLQTHFDQITGQEARTLVPVLSDAVGHVVRIHGNRTINPPKLIQVLVAKLIERGVRFENGREVQRIQPGNRQHHLAFTDGTLHQSDAVVLCAGAWISRLAKSFGVKRVVQGGRGYSFTVSLDPQPTVSLDFPKQRMVGTPYNDGYRISGMMEFKRINAPIDRQRLQSIAENAKPMFSGADFDDRQDEWVGARPVTSDGLPLIGSTRVPGVYLAGGHGMWGMTLGPISGQLLARQMMTGVQPNELVPFSPLR